MKMWTRWAGMLAAVALVGAGPVRMDTTTVRRALRRGQVAWLADRASQMIRANGDMPDAFAWYAAAMEVAACPQEAVDTFEMAIGSEWYENTSVYRHGNALRVLGREHEATELRWDYADPSGPPERIAGLLYNVMLDHLHAGQWADARETSETLSWTAPGVASTHGYLALSSALMNDQDEYLFQAFLTTRNGQQHFSADLAAMVAAIRDSDWDAAWLASERARRHGGMTPSLWAIQAEILRQDGQVDECLFHLGARRYALHTHPELLAAEVLCRADAGDVAGAAESQERLAQLFPHVPTSPFPRAVACSPCDGAQMGTRANQ